MTAEHLQHMNQVLSDWRSQFDIAGAIDAAFTQDDKGQLCFNGLSLCATQDLALEASEYDAQEIHFVFSGGRSITIAVGWPEDEPPRWSGICVEYANLN